MTKKLFKQVISIALIVAMLVSLTAMAAEPGSPWTNLPEIAPYGFDPDMMPQMGEFDPFNMENQLIDMSLLEVDPNDLSELSPEELEELLREHELYAWENDPRRLEMNEFAMLLSEGRGFSDLSESNRSLIFMQLGISDEAAGITGQLFGTMQRDGFTLAESIELIMIMSGGLFDYIEAQSILRAMPDFNEGSSAI